MKIWKFPLEFDGPNNPVEVFIPEGAELLCVQTQQGRPCLWAQVDEHPAIPRVRRRLVAYFTGGDMPDEPGIYFATYQTLTEWGVLVWHVYELV